MGCVCFLAFLVSLILTVGAIRFPRELEEIREPKVLWWGQRHVLLMNSNGTVGVKRPQGHKCEACEVQLRSLCETHRKSVSGCPKKKLGKGVNIAATLMMLHFTATRRYLCLHQNKTFYAVANPDASVIEECAFYVVQEGPDDSYTSIYHFKYPWKKRNCRLKERRDNATNRCHKFYLKRGGRHLLTVTKRKSFNESHWLLVGRRN